MINYYLKYNKKNLKSNIQKLILELERIFKLEGIKIENTNSENYPEVKQVISSVEYRNLCNLIFTARKNIKKIPILNKYFKPAVKIENYKYKFADLFAGCGGLSLGLENAGFNCVFVNEIDEVFAETHYFNNQIPLDNYYVGDINKLVSEIALIKDKVSDLDLVCGGPPCQGFSEANRQRVIDDPRNNLYKAYLQFLKASKPKFFIMENVVGMAKKIDEIIDNFNLYLNSEYDIHYSILNAHDFGAPQSRKRFFIIGNRVGVNTKQIFKDIKKEAGINNFVLRDALENLPKLQPKYIRNNNDLENKEFGFSITKQMTKRTKYLDFINNLKSFDYVLNHKNRYNNDRDIEIFTKLPQGANSLHPSIKNIMPYASRNHMFKDKYFKLDETKTCKTITSHMKFDCNMYIHPNQSRGLSPREAARVQTFPDDYFLRGSQNNWFAQVGNAVPVKLAEILGKHIIKYL